MGLALCYVCSECSVSLGGGGKAIGTVHWDTQLHRLLPQKAWSHHLCITHWQDFHTFTLSWAGCLVLGNHMASIGFLRFLHWTEEELYKQLVRRW